MASGMRLKPENARQLLQWVDRHAPNSFPYYKEHQSYHVLMNGGTVVLYIIGAKIAGKIKPEKNGYVRMYLYDTPRDQNRSALPLVSVSLPEIVTKTETNDDRYFRQWLNQVISEIEYREYLEHEEWCLVCGAWWEDMHSEGCIYA